MEVSLVMFKADGSRRDFPISKERVVIGRMSNCDLRIPLSSVSREHCEINYKGNNVSFADLGSSNGTYHNGVKVRKAGLLPGDELVVGPVVFTVVIDGEPADIRPVRTILKESDTKKDATQEAISSPDAALPMDLDDESRGAESGQEIQSGLGSDLLDSDGGLSGFDDAIETAQVEEDAAMELDDDEDDDFQIEPAAETTSLDDDSDDDFQIEAGDEVEDSAALGNDDDDDDDFELEEGLEGEDRPLDVAAEAATPDDDDDDDFVIEPTGAAAKEDAASDDPGGNSDDFDFDLDEEAGDDSGFDFEDDDDSGFDF